MTIKIMSMILVCVKNNYTSKLYVVGQAKCCLSFGFSVRHLALFMSVEN